MKLLFVPRSASASLVVSFACSSLISRSAGFQQSFAGTTSRKRTTFSSQDQSRIYSAVADETTSIETQVKGKEGSTATKVNEASKDGSLSAPFQHTKDAIMAKVRDSGSVSPNMEGFLEHFVTEYGSALEKSNSKDATPEGYAKRMVSALEFGFKYGMPNSPDHYKFGVTHDAIRGDDKYPTDFYSWGGDFFRPCMDLDHSVVLGEENLKEAFEYMKKGENVVFFANHQSEADPQVFSCLLEQVNMGKEGEQIYYVAGHKVTTDALAIPFSMGRNLLCIHSKKHIDADPESKPIKMRQNLSTMSAMQKKMKAGSHAFWVAPSGGRDRRDVSTGKVPVAPFDQKTIDMFRLMSNKAKTPTHFYSLAMVSYDLCPPPDTVEAGTGEMRNVRFSPVGVACSKELENVGGLESRHLFTEHAQEEVERCYEALQLGIAENFEA